ncbi:DUF4238 domain-containing protein [Rhodococcus erythropolis]|nr:DUF4238 domain-containing protein [Rhodococcus erythropolis]
MIDSAADHPDMAPYHHIVPRFYLAQFADLKMIQRVELQYGTTRKKSVKSVGGLQGFYSVPETEDPEIFERELFGAIENKAAPIFKKIIHEDYWPLIPEDRAIVANFLAIQFLRGNDRRTEQSEMKTSLGRLQTAANGPDAVRDELKELTSKEGVTLDFDEVWNERVGPDTKVEATAAEHMKLLVRSLPEAIDCFAGRPWMLVPFNRKHLLTCDSPVSLAPHPEDSPFMGVGLATAYRILFPISRQFGLLLTTPNEETPGEDLEKSTIKIWSGNADEKLTPTARLARQFNELSIANARENIFHHPDDGDLVPDPLPQPRTQEMQADGLEELIAELNAQGGLAQGHDEE